MLFRSLVLAPDDAGGGGPPMITVRHGDQDIQVTLPDGYVPKAEVDKNYVIKAAHNDQMARLRTQLDGMKGFRNPDDLLADAEFRTKAFEAWKIKDDKALSEDFKSQLERQRNELTAREIAPRQAKLDAASEKITGLRAKDLRGQIVTAAAAHRIEEKYLKAPTRGGKPLIVSMLEDAFAFDEQHDEWYAKGTNGQPFQFSTGGDAPYMSIGEFLGQWAGAEGKDFVRSEKQGGAGAATGGESKIPGQVGKELRLTAEQIRDPQIFRQKQAEAEKNGLHIVEI